MKKLSIVLAAMLVGTAAHADVFGDINKDSKVNINDATSLVQVVLTSSTDLRNHDINGDGVCNISDVTELIQCILQGKYPERPIAFVDLGLSVKWASYNIGATAEQEAGDFFAWGEVEPKTEYTTANSLTYSKNMSTLYSDGVIDDEYELTPDYDAATVLYGGNWRMPTKAEIQELFTQCTWEDSEEYFPIIGVKITGPNGNSIFLPQSGQKVDDELIDEGYFGYFWSSTCDELGDAFGNANGIALGFSGSGEKLVSSDSRHFGRPIRPVKD